MFLRFAMDARRSKGIAEILVVEYGWTNSSTLLKAHIAFALVTQLNVDTVWDYHTIVARYFLRRYPAIVPDLFEESNYSRKNFLDLLVILWDNHDEKALSVVVEAVQNISNDKKVIVLNKKNEKYFLIQTPQVSDQWDRVEYYFWNYYDSPVTLFAGKILYRHDSVTVISDSGGIHEEYTPWVFHASKDAIVYQLLHHNRFRT